VHSPMLSRTGSAAHGRNPGSSGVRRQHSKQHLQHSLRGQRSPDGARRSPLSPTDPTDLFASYAQAQPGERTTQTPSARQAPRTIPSLCGMASRSALPATPMLQCTFPTACGHVTAGSARRQSAAQTMTNVFASIEGFDDPLASDGGSNGGLRLADVLRYVGATPGRCGAAGRGGA
jgi:hypothetical protein